MGVSLALEKVNRVRAENPDPLRDDSPSALSFGASERGDDDYDDDDNERSRRRDSTGFDDRGREARKGQGRRFAVLLSPALRPPVVVGSADTTEPDRLSGSIAGERNGVASGATEGGRHSVHFNHAIHNFAIRKRVSGAESIEQERRRFSVYLELDSLHGSAIPVALAPAIALLHRTVYISVILYCATYRERCGVNVFSARTVLSTRSAGQYVFA